MMVGFAARLVSSPIPYIATALPTFLRNSRFVPSISTKTPNPNLRTRRTLVFAEGNNGINKDSTNNGFVNEEDFKKDQQSILNFSWKDLLNPDPENIFAVGLTGILTWASIQVLWQLFFISLAIILAALKYSFIAALLLFILITLL